MREHFLLRGEPQENVIEKMFKQKKPLKIGK